MAFQRRRSTGVKCESLPLPEKRDRDEETPSEALSCILSPSEALRLDGAMYPN
jgi:hypothetical protein